MNNESDPFSHYVNWFRWPLRGDGVVGGCNQELVPAERRSWIGPRRLISRDTRIISLINPFYLRSLEEKCTKQGKVLFYQLRNIFIIYLTSKNLVLFKQWQKLHLFNTEKLYFHETRKNLVFFEPRIILLQQRNNLAFLWQGKILF